MNHNNMTKNKRTVQMKNVEDETYKRLQAWCELNGNATYAFFLKTDKRLKSIVI